MIFTLSVLLIQLASVRSVLLTALENSFSDQFNGKVSIVSVEGLFPFAMSANAVSLFLNEKESHSGWSDNPVYIDKIKFDLDWSELFYGKIKMKQLEIIDAEILVEKKGDRWNVEYLFGSRGNSVVQTLPTTNKSPIDSLDSKSDSLIQKKIYEFYAPEIKLKNLKISWNIPDLSDLKQVNLPDRGVIRVNDADILVEKKRFHFFIDVKNLEMISNVIQPKQFSFSSQIYQDSAGVELSRFDIKTPKSNVSISGKTTLKTLNLSVDNWLTSGDVQIEMKKTHIDLQEWSTLFPSLKPYNERVELELDVEKKKEFFQINRLSVVNDESVLVLDGTIDLASELKKTISSLKVTFTDVPSKKISQYIPQVREIALNPVLLSGNAKLIGTNGSFSTFAEIRAGESVLTVQTDLNFSSVFELNYWKWSSVWKDVKPNYFISETHTGFQELRINGTGFGLKFPESIRSVSVSAKKLNVLNHHADVVSIKLDRNSKTHEISINTDWRYKQGRFTSQALVHIDEDSSVYSIKADLSKFNLKHTGHPFFDYNSEITGNVSINGHGRSLETLYGDIVVDIHEGIIDGKSIGSHQFYADLNNPEQPVRQLRVTSSAFDLIAKSTINPNEWMKWGKQWGTALVQQFQGMAFNTGTDSLPPLSPLFLKKQEMNVSVQLKDLSYIFHYWPQLKPFDAKTDLSVSLAVGNGELLVNAILNDTWFKKEDINVQALSGLLTYSIKDLNQIKKSQLGTLKLFSDELKWKSFDLKHFETLIQQEGNRTQFQIAGDSLFADSFATEFDMELNSTLNFYLNKLDIKTGTSSWTMNKPSFIEVNNKGETRIDEFALINKNQQIEIDGTFSSKESDAVNYRIKQLDAGKLADLLPKDYGFSGELNAQFSTKTLSSVPQFEGFAKINQFRINDRIVGDVDIMSQLIPQKNQFDVEIGIQLDSTNYPEYYQKNEQIGNDWKIKGYIYRPTNQARSSDTLFYAKIDINEADMWMLRSFIPPIFTQVEGKATGQGFITGGTGWFDFSTLFHLEQVHAIPGFLETDFYLSGPVRFGFHEGVELDSVKVSDGKGGSGILTGSINTGYFMKNTYKGYNLKAEANQLQFLNNKFSPETPFYGTVAGTGVITLTGPFSKPFLATQEPVQTTPNSRLSIPLLDEQKVETQAKFIEFVSTFFDSTKTLTQNITLENNTANQQVNRGVTFTELFQMNLQFTAPSQTQFELVFDPITGEILTANGGGSLNIILENQEFGMYGYFDVYGGDYLFMGGDIFSRKFTINDGGTLSWEGAPQNPRVNLTAVYKSRPSMQPLGIDARVPIDLILKLNGTIEALQNDFYFEIPNTTFQDPTINTALRILNSEEQKLPQATSLLLTGSFFAINTAGTTNTNSFGNNLQNNATQTGLSQLLSNQINTILNKSISNLDIDLNLTSFDQADLGIALRLFDDRLELRRDGQLINNDPNAVNQNIIGDLRASYKISRALSVEVFYRQDPSLSGFNAVQDQVQNVSGVGLQYQVQFNKWSDLPKIIWRNIINFFGFGKSRNDDLAASSR